MAYLLVFLMCAVCVAVEYFWRDSQALATVPTTGPTAWPDGPVATSSREAASASIGIDAGPMTQVPDGVFLAPGHTWLQLEPSGSVRLGGDRFSLTALGGVDRLDVAAEGSRLRRGDVLARLGSGQRDLSLLSPVEGTVTAVNHSMLAKPEDLAADPYEGGWFCSIRPERLSASLKRMVIAEETEEWMRSELWRLRDILSSREGELTALADGGAPVEGLASCLEQDEWQDFIERFFEAPEQPGSPS